LLNSTCDLGFKVLLVDYNNEPSTFKHQKF